MLRLNAKIYNVDNIEGFIITDGTYFYGMDIKTATKFCANYKIEGLTASKGELKTSDEVQEYQSNSGITVPYYSYDQLEQIYKKYKYGIRYVDVPFFGEVTVKGKLTVGAGRIAYIVTTSNNKDIIVTKLTIGKLAEKGQAFNCTIGKAVKHADGFAITANVPYLDLDLIPLEQRVIYNVVGDIENNDYKDGYIVNKLEFDIFGRFIGITLDKGKDGGIQYYSIADYEDILRGNIASQIKTSNAVTPGKESNYPSVISLKLKHYEILGNKITPEVAAKLIGKDNVVINKKYRPDFTDFSTGSVKYNVESFKDCVDIYLKTKPFMQNLMEGNIEMVIKPTDKIECIGMAINTGRIHQKVLAMSLWSLIFKFNGKYILLPYSVVTRSAIQKKLNIDFDSLKLYDLGHSKTLKGYREYNMENGETKVELQKFD